MATSAPAIRPLPPANTALTAGGGTHSVGPGYQGTAQSNGNPTAPGQISQVYAQYLGSLDSFIRGGNFPAVSVNGNAVLTVVGGQTLTGGFTETPFDFGTVTTGTITPNPSKCLKQKVTNNGAFTIAATAEVGDLELLVTNAAGAGAITLSGFTKQFTGDAFDTTNGHKFVVFIYAFDAGVTGVLVKALQ
jgi:hypothetical protein